MSSAPRFSSVPTLLAVFIGFTTGAAARAQVGIDLGDLAAGGDGFGTAPPDVIGINPETGLLDTAFIDAPIGIADGMALQPVDEGVSPFIDSVFIIDTEDMPIHSAGVTFKFPVEDLLDPPNTWGQILNNHIGGEIVTPIALGGIAFDRGVGIHASAGITFDLDELRSISDSVGQVFAYAGMGDSSFDTGGGTGFVTAYLILSNDVEVLASASHRASTDDTSAKGKLLRLLIPPEARYLTLACGAGNGQFFFNSSAFGNALITSSDFCPLPPATATRDLKTNRSPDRHSGDYVGGDVIDVEIVLTEVRVADASCSAPAGVVIQEGLPAGWVPSQITEGGTYDPGTGSISWTLAGPAVEEGKKLAYKVTAADTQDLEAVFSGTITESSPQALSSPIQGESRLLNDIPFDACGGIRAWNVLGAYLQPFGDNPGDDNLRLDYLTDGDLAETTFAFVPGTQIATLFGGDGFSSGAASTGIVGGTQGRNASGVPEVFAFNSADGFINLNDQAFGGNPDGVMAYAQTYVLNTTGQTMEVHLGISSDDSVQVFLNEEEVWFNSVARGGSPACNPLDLSPDGIKFTAPHTLAPGENRLLVKVWEGGGGWNFSLRFQDALLNPITEGLEIVKIPPGRCHLPALQAARDVATTETIRIEGVERPLWRAGETYAVMLSLADPRAPSGDCQAPASVRIEETVPEGWTPVPGSASNGGVIAGGKITWNLTGAAIGPGTLTYRVASAGAPRTVFFRGKLSDAGSLGQAAVFGEGALYQPTTFSGEGFITQWLLLGPYRQPVGPTATPGIPNIQRDHLTDGASINEIDVLPEAGDTVNTAYGPAGPARSIGLEPTAAAINPGGVPTWLDWRDLDDTIDFTQVCGGDENQVMFYAVTYVEVEAAVFVDVGLASDDSVQVLLDGEELWINNVARPAGLPNEVLDLVPGSGIAALSPLAAGRHRLMVKVFEGGGDHSFRLRFQDPVNFLPITEGISICLDPDDCGVIVDGGFVRGDGDGKSPLNITDPIYVLNALFAGGPAVPCPDAADADDSGGLNITDPIRTLNFLFSGGVEPPAPGPTTCGPDPTGDGLGPCTYQC